MTARTSTLASQQPQQAHTDRRDSRGEPANLSFHYGTIGIQAVAAAARYTGVRKNPAASRNEPRIDLRFVESAV
jgi:hypothetical protein